MYRVCSSINLYAEVLDFIASKLSLYKRQLVASSAGRVFALRTQYSGFDPQDHINRL